MHRKVKEGHKLGPHEDGFVAQVHHLSLNGHPPSDLAESIVTGMQLLGYTLADEEGLGAILISPDETNVYVVPPEVIEWMIEQKLLARPTKLH